MTTPSDPQTAKGTDAASDVDTAPLPHRLHPWSWLFAVIAQLQSVALPLVAVLLFGGGDRWQFWGLLAGVFIAIASVVQYFTYRYGVVGDELVIRAGILHRNRRHVPLQRIRNVSLKQNVLHRAFGVAEVRLESAGGRGAEATMRVLSVDAARGLEALIEGHVDEQRGGGADERGVEARPPLLTLNSGELFRLGLVSNRGMVVVGAATAAIWQLLPDDADGWIGDGAQALFGRAMAAHVGWLGWLLAIAALLLTALLALRLLSIALAFVQYHGFALRLERNRLSVERGLLSRVRASAPPRRIQFWNRRESLLQRWLGRQSLHVETAVGMQEDGASSAIDHLAPIAPPATIDALLARLLPARACDDMEWNPIHPRAWRRMVKWPLALLVLVSAPLCWLFGAPGALPLLLVPWLLWSARRRAESSGWALNGQLVSWRSGWLDRQQSFAEVNKLQAVQLLQSPFDRRHHMATLRVDTAGAHPLSSSLRIDMHYLPEADARKLYRRLAAGIASTPLDW
ncbi:MAG: PH domain-containing protein [Xanthomonadales bacterium]|nr:PH domain-containing protein [Xanthomonadales bacterium]